MAKKPTPKKANQQKASPGPGKAKPSVTSQRNDDRLRTWSIMAFLGLSALIFLQARIKLLGIPLERDEGSFAYIGHWLMRGRELYTDMLDSKLPGLYTIYGMFTTIFGYNATGVHVGLLVANVASGICLYLLVKELYNQLMAGIATAFFLFLVISPNVVGFASHATQLLTPFVIGGSLLFWRGIRSGKLILFFLAGLMIGIAFSIKQQAAIYGIILAALWWPARYIWYRKLNNRTPFMEWVLLGIGGLLPLIIVLCYFGIVGRLGEFYNWTVVQPIHLAGSYQEPWYTMFIATLPIVTKQFEGIWILAGLGLGLIFASGFKRENPWFGFLFAVMGIVSVAIGAAYYQHYFVLAMPGLALLAACTLHWVAQKTGKVGPYISLLIAGILIGWSVKGRSDYYFDPDYGKIHFQVYGQNMFPEIEKLGKELARRVPEGERIAVMGSEPEVLVAAGRESCSRHLMVYALLIDPVLSPPLQEEYIRELQDCAPQYIVFAPGTGSWTKGYDNLQFFKQLLEWVEQNYTAVGMAESQDDKPGVIVWDEALKNHQSISDYKVYVLKRKTEASSSTN